MRKLNTTEKGDVFEKKVFDIFDQLLSNGDFYLNSKSSKIFRKKSYYSEARKGYIVVDISIESYIGNAEKYTSLLIIECKNYSKAIPVDDIEEFSSKLNQIGEHNTKGIVVTNSFFQEGAFNFALSKKISLIRINENKDFEWVNYRKDSKLKYLDYSRSKLVLCSHQLKETNFIGFHGNLGFLTISQMFLEMAIIDRFINQSRFINIPYLQEERIEYIIAELPHRAIYVEGKLNTENLCRFLNERNKIAFNFDIQLNQDLGILGKINFNPITICISNHLLTDINRWRFTLAHEVGHYLLHQELMTNYLDEYLDNENSIIIDQALTDTKNNRLEFQANYFASRLLIPHLYLRDIVFEYFRKERINKGYLYLDTQPCNVALTYNLLGEIQYYFGVSKEVAKYRLIKDKFLVENC